MYERGKNPQYTKKSQSSQKIRVEKKGRIGYGWAMKRWDGDGIENLILLSPLLGSSRMPS